MKKNFLVGLFVVFTLTACDDWWEGVSDSGSGSEKPAETQVVDLSESNSTTASANTNTSSSTGPGTTAVASVADKPAATNTPSAEPAAIPAKAASAPVASAQPEPVVAEAKSPVSNASSDKCGVGNYAFVTTRDNKRHFTGTLKSGGRALYQLKGGPSGTWSLRGDKMNISGPFKMPGRKNATLHMTVSKRAPDCRVMEARGKSPGGSDMAVRRM